MLNAMSECNNKYKMCDPGGVSQVIRYLVSVSFILMKSYLFDCCRKRCYVRGNFERFGFFSHTLKLETKGLVNANLLIRTYML